MRVLVCGGRDFDKIDLVYKVLDELREQYQITCFITGHARGADWLAEMYADQYDILLSIYPADWNTHGKKAGYLRNKQMLEEGKPDLVIAFPGGKGTAMMVRLAQEAGVETRVIPYPDVRDNGSTVQ